MKLVLGGLAALFVGFIGWFFLSVVFGVTAGAGITTREEAPPLLVQFFLIMVGGPIWFWFVLPVYKLIRGGKRDGK